MSSLEKRIIRIDVPGVRSRPFKEPIGGETYSTVHVVLEGAGPDGKHAFFNLDMTEFVPPDDDSSIVVLKFEPKA